jgi:hypothetical protein
MPCLFLCNAARSNRFVIGTGGKDLEGARWRAGVAVEKGSDGADRERSIQCRALVSSLVVVEDVEFNDSDGLGVAGRTTDQSLSSVPPSAGEEDAGGCEVDCARICSFHRIYREWNDCRSKGI